MEEARVVRGSPYQEFLQRVSNLLGISKGEISDLKEFQGKTIRLYQIFGEYLKTVFIDSNPYGCGLFFRICVSQKLLLSNKTMNIA